MTTHELFLLILRRWYVFVIAIVIAGVTIFGLNSTPRIYSATAELEIQAPKSMPANIAGEDPRETLISYTGALIKRYEAEYPNDQLSSPNATLFGNGMREGVAVQAVASGNQWVINFTRSAASIQVASTQWAEVMPTIKRVATELDTVSKAMQRETGAKERYYITTSIDLDLVTVYSFGQTRTSRYLGTGTMIGVGLLLATLVAKGIDRIALLRKRLSDSTIVAPRHDNFSVAPQPGRK